MLIKRLLKETLFWSIPFFVLISLLFFVNIIKKDLIYSHYLFATVKDPHNWMYDYTVTPVKKFLIKLRNDKKNYLPKVGLYLSESKINYFLEDIPKTVKDWQQGKIIHYLDESNLKDMKIRLRGDNPANWLMEKKSFRIKLKKSEMHGRQRYYNYLPFQVGILSSTRMALNSKLLAPKVRPIELLMNGQKKGLYLESENFNENFLRRNRVMPVNFYKGENFNQETKIALPKYLYNNSGLWSKEAYFNFYEKENKDDLKKFLEILSNSKNNSEKFKILQSYLDEDYLGRYLAYIVLTQNFQTNRINNNRLIIDPWKGQVFPVITDPSLGTTLDLKFDSSANDLTSILNQNSKFIDLKYFYLKKFLSEENIIDDEIDYLRQNKENINNVIRNDPVLSNIIPEILNKNDNLRIIDNTIETLEVRKKNLFNELSKIPKVFWTNKSENFLIILNDKLPVSNVKLYFENKTPDWVFIDENYNNIYDSNEKKFFKKNESIDLDVSLYSNRINFANYYDLSQNNILPTETKFSLISSNGNNPNEIKANNIFSKKLFTIKKKKSEGLIASKTIKSNKVIFINNKEKENLETKVLSGKIIVDSDLVFEKPVLIKEGSTFLIDEGINIIFKNKVEALGTKDNKIKIKASSKKPWGTLAIIGKKTAGSKLSHLEIENGSGTFSDQFYFTSMLSVHNTRDVSLDNIKLSSNQYYDDMLHIIYSSNIVIKNSFFLNANGDAIDIDMCEKVSIINSNIYDAQNDGIDLMESDIIIKNVNVVNSKDKGISVGEATTVKILKSNLEENNIAVAIKDNSKSLMKETKFLNNKTQISAYKKNLQYGSGGDVIIQNSLFENSKNEFYSRKSNILIENTKIIGKVFKDGKNIIIND